METQVATQEKTQDKVVLATTFGREQIETIKNTVAQGVTDAELDLFVQVCTSTGLNPFAKQIYAISRFNKKAGREVMTIQTSIDGFRIIAERSGKYRGQTVPLYYDENGDSFEVWLKSKPPSACKIGVMRSDFDAPLFAIALWTSYVQTYKDGNPSGLWAKMPEVMLAKVAEALALRKAFPQNMSGLYTSDEMAQADNVAQNDFQNKEFEKMDSHVKDDKKKPTEKKKSSKKQRDLLEKLGKSSRLTADEKVNIVKALKTEMTPKQASDLIEKVTSRIDERKASESDELDKSEEIQPPPEPEVEGPIEAFKYHEAFISYVMLKTDWTRAKVRGWADGMVKSAYDQPSYLRLDSEESVDFLSRITADEFPLF